MRNQILILAVLGCFGGCRSITAPVPPGPIGTAIANESNIQPSAPPAPPTEACRPTVLYGRDVDQRQEQTLICRLVPAESALLCVKLEKDF